MLFTIGFRVGLLSFAVISLAWKKPTSEEMAERVASGAINQAQPRQARARSSLSQYTGHPIPWVIRHLSDRLTNSLTH